MLEYTEDGTAATAHGCICGPQIIELLLDFCQLWMHRKDRRLEIVDKLILPGLDRLANDVAAAFRRLLRSDGSIGILGAYGDVVALHHHNVISLHVISRTAYRHQYIADTLSIAGSISILRVRTDEVGTVSKAWFKVPSAIKFNLTGKLNPWVSGKDVILHIIGMIGVDGALYKSMEFAGPGVSTLTMDDRFTIANMAIEAGGKNGIFPVDDLAREYMKEHSKRPFVEYTADDDAEYDQVIDIDLSTIKSTVAFPHLPENTHTVDSIDDIKIDQVVIGSCTNGRIDDLRCAAKILEGRKVAKGLRVIVIPATQKIYMQAIEEGLVQTFIKAGAVVSTPTCGPCLGGYMGILAEGERCVSTTNRNFVGRMGHVDSEIYLASPAVAAASRSEERRVGKECRSRWSPYH